MVPIWTSRVCVCLISLDDLCIADIFPPLIVNLDIWSVVVT